MFFVFLRCELNKNKWNKYTSIDSNVPMLAMFHGKWCETCRQLHPIFRKVQEEYSSDPNIMIAGCNCGLQEGLCKTIDMDFFPAFITYSHGNRRDQDFIGDLDEMREAVDDLEMSFLNNTLGPYINNHDTQFIFRMYAKSDSIFHIIKRGICLSNTTNTKFYYEYGPYNKDGELLIRFDDSQEIKMEGSFSADNIRDFIMFYSSPIQKSWTINMLQNWTRPFAMFVADPIHFPLFEQAANSLYRDVSWGSASSIGRSKAMSIFKISQKDLPAIALVYGSLNEYILFKNQDSLAKIESSIKSRDSANRISVDLQRSNTIMHRIFLIIIIASCVAMLTVVAKSIHKHYKITSEHLD